MANRYYSRGRFVKESRASHQTPEERAKKLEEKNKIVIPSHDIEGLKPPFTREQLFKLGIKEIRDIAKAIFNMNVPNKKPTAIEKIMRTQLAMGLTTENPVDEAQD